MSRDEFADCRQPRLAPARRRVLLACFAVAAIAGLSVASAALMEHAAWGAFAALGLLVATWRFFVPKRGGDRGTDRRSVPPRGADIHVCPSRSRPLERRQAGKPAPRRGTACRSVLPPRLKHAFAVDPPGPAEPTPEERPIVEALCREIVRRRLATPAIAFLEMSRPLNYVASQALAFFGPVLSAITDSRGHAHVSAFLERRGSIDWLLERIEQMPNVEVRTTKE
ncbi:MAG: hypothetical protein WD069_11130 [Planctomycetales bacterium]